VGKKVFAEDGSIYAAVQQGLAVSPHRGVIGTREERIYYFQKFVLDGTRQQPTIELPQTAAEWVNGSISARSVSDG
jgi:hypothetical protein